MEKLKDELISKKKVIVSGLSEFLNRGLRDLYDKYQIVYDELVENSEDEIVEKENNDYKET